MHHSIDASQKPSTVSENLLSIFENIKNKIKSSISATIEAAVAAVEDAPKSVSVLVVETTAGSVTEPEVKTVVVQPIQSVTVTKVEPVVVPEAVAVPESVAVPAEVVAAPEPVGFFKAR